LANKTLKLLLGLANKIFGLLLGSVFGYAFCSVFVFFSSYFYFIEVNKELNTSQNIGSTFFNWFYKNSFINYISVLNIIFIITILSATLIIKKTIKKKIKIRQQKEENENNRQAELKRQEDEKEKEIIRQKIIKNINDLKAKAERQDELAMFELGNLYMKYNDEGYSYSNIEEAEYWYEKSSALGHRGAQDAFAKIKRDKKNRELEQKANEEQERATERIRRAMAEQILLQTKSIRQSVQDNIESLLPTCNTCTRNRYCLDAYDRKGTGCPKHSSYN
jgi:hypothetical protein